MAELTGADAVREYITLADRPCFEIYRANDNSKQPVFRYKGQRGVDASNEFDKWAAIYNSGGNNYETYRIVVSKGIDETMDPADNTSKGNAGSIKKHSSMSTTFVLNSIGGMGAPTRDKDGSVIYYVPPGQQPAPKMDLTGYVAKADMEAAIANAIKHSQQDYELKLMNMRLTELEAENLMLRRDIADYDEDEEEEDDEKMGAEKALTEIWTPAAIKDVMNTGKGIYLDIKGANSTMTGTNNAPVKLNAVAGEPAVKPQNVAIPPGAAPGSFPPYVERTEANKEQVHQDQSIKINEAVAQLYQNYDAWLGDDLMTILTIAKNKPNRFKGVIESLREE